MKDIKKIVLTGGPCAGKTTALVRIIEHFSSLGYKVFTIPEVPTLYSLAGWNYLTPNKNLYYEGERAILKTQLVLEDTFMQMAEVCKKPTLIVCDRGTLDISAYMTPEMREVLGIEPGRDGSMRWLLSLGGYEYILKLDTGLGDKEEFERDLQKVSERTRLKIKVAEDGWVDLQPTEDLYKKCKSFLQA